MSVVHCAIIKVMWSGEIKIVLNIFCIIFVFNKCNFYCDRWLKHQAKAADVKCDRMADETNTMTTVSVSPPPPASSTSQAAAAAAATAAGTSVMAALGTTGNGAGSQLCRVKLTEQQLETATRDELVKHWRDQDAYVDMVEAQATSNEGRLTCDSLIDLIAFIGNI